MSVSTGTNSARCSAQTPWPVDHDDGWRAEPNNYGEGVPAGWRAPIIPSTSSPRYHANRQFTQPPEGNQFIKNAQWAAPIAPPESPELSSERLGAMVLFERYDTDKDGKVDLNQCSLMVPLPLCITHHPCLVLCLPVSHTFTGSLSLHLALSSSVDAPTKALSRG